MASEARAYAHLLAPGRIGSLELRNRIVMSPMGSNLAEPDGQLGERILAYYEARAAGGVGMVVVGVGAIAFPAGACNPRQVAISDDAFLPGLRKLTQRVHAHGARAAIQLQHAGKVAVRDIVAGRPMWVPSVLPFKRTDLADDLTPEELDLWTRELRAQGAGIAFHEMTIEDIGALVEQFATAAERARRAGFDGVELHAGHGYILSSFLSPASNRREDDYGGLLENRARFLVEVIRAAKERTGGDFPVWCRIDGCELRTENGITVEDAQRTAEIAEAAGADAVHVSAYADSSTGAAFTEAPLVHRPGGFVELALGVKKRVSVPVIAVGRIEPEDAEALIARGGADFVAMARKLLADPELPSKLERGHSRDVRPCVYSYHCVGQIFLNQQSRCIVNPSSGREFEVGPIGRAAEPRRVLVVGGGPAGMEAARIAALRGHEVALFERAGKLGGALGVSRLFHEPNGRLVDHLESQLRGLPIEIVLDCEATPERVASHEPDVVWVATGARRVRPAVPGIDAAHVLDPGGWLDPYGKAAEPGNAVLVLGGGLVGLQLADHWSERGHRVTVLEPGAHFASEMSPPRRWRVLAALRARGVDLFSGAVLEAVDPGVVRFRVAASAEEARADTVLVAGGWEPDASLARALATPGREVVRLGDCADPALLAGAIASAHRVARAL